MKTISHEADFCVVGGGMSGLCAAIAAARHGAKTVLVQDRPVLGGNASSEIRMWICGAHGENMRETGILDEILLENHYRNPLTNYSIWDSILYEKARFQPNLELLLNCSINSLEMDGKRIAAVKGWQGTAEAWHEIRAKFFADCSGDSILAPLSGAEIRVGREAASEFGEDIAPAEADRRTMGMSCLLQTREYSSPQSFIAPSWANKYAADDVPLHHPYRGHNQGDAYGNFWYIELGGEYDSIHDTEMLRDELLKVVFGVWDHIKNCGDHGAANWALDWVGFLPGKRESRRYVGDHILNQNDIRDGGPFADIVAYGGWSMDDHHPAGFVHPGKPTIFHPAPSPYGIPYRSLYSRNIENLFCAGRNISATHAALSSTRVMATCSIIGQAVGTAAAMANSLGISPREVGKRSIKELQQRLMEDDSYLPGLLRDVSELSRGADLRASSGDPEALRNGVDRPVGKLDNGWTGAPGSWLEYSFDSRKSIKEARIVCDGKLNDRGLNSRCNYPLNQPRMASPETLMKSFRLEAKDSAGKWQTIAKVENNYQRLVRIPCPCETNAVRLVPESTWGASEFHIFAWELR